MTTEAEIPLQYSADCKIEETAKGIRIHVHAYANDSQMAINTAFDMYKYAKSVAEGENILMAPMSIEEVSKKQNGK